MLYLLLYNAYTSYKWPKKKTNAESIFIRKHIKTNFFTRNREMDHPTRRDSETRKLRTRPALQHVGHAPTRRGVHARAQWIGCGVEPLGGRLYIRESVASIKQLFVFLVTHSSISMLTIDHVLLARDFSPGSDQALAYAASIAQAFDATLHLLYAEVLHDDPFAPADRTRPESPREQIRERLLQDGNGNALADIYDGLAIETAIERNVAAAPAILQYARSKDVDLIVTGTHGRRGMKRVLLGSVAEEVVHRADRSVLTVRHREEAPKQLAPLEALLVPIDFSKFSREALRHARELAALTNARLDLVHVIEENMHPAFYVGGVGSVYNADPKIEEKARTRLWSFYERTGGVEAPHVDVHVMPGKASQKIPSLAEELESDLIVVSTHGRTGMERFFLGSVTEKVVRHATVPTLTVKSFGKSLLPDDVIIREPDTA